MDLLTGVKDLRVVESVAPRLEMIDLEIDQLVNKTTAGPRLSVNPVPIKRSFVGRICADILVTILQNHSLEVEVNSPQDSLGWSDQWLWSSAGLTFGLASSIIYIYCFYPTVTSVGGRCCDQWDHVKYFKSTLQTGDFYISPLIREPRIAPVWISIFLSKV